MNDDPYGMLQAQARMLSLQAEISTKLVEVEGMKAANSARSINQETPMYTEDHFLGAASDIQDLSHRLLQEI